MTSAVPEYGGTAVGGKLPNRGEGYEMSDFVTLAASVCGIWYFFILLVQVIGCRQLYRYYSSKPAESASLKLPLAEIPHITILRPVKGLEPCLYECLAATFRQTYPRDKLTICFCVSSRSDPAYPVLRHLLDDFSTFDAKLFIEEEDPNLSGHGGEASNLGPNPKIRNMSRGYREAKGDILWIIDCNVWIGKGVAGRMVDKLCGFSPDGRRVLPYKFVHQLPLVVDIVGASGTAEVSSVLSKPYENGRQLSPGSKTANKMSAVPGTSTLSRVLRNGGGRLDEMFMASTHAKFYTAINTVSISPCIVGKSSMFRRSHLNHLTSGASPYSPGINFFSENICEDHLIGDLLWRKKVPGEERGERWGKHALVFGDLAIQPVAGMSVQEFIARRVRWLRVRKWTVTLATLVEPGVESLLCSAYGSFTLTTLPWFHDILGIPQTWTAFLLIWLMNVIAWATVDWFVYAKLHSASSVEVDQDTPFFARPLRSISRRSFGEWMLAWLGRESLALPIWTWAVWGGMTVVWRSKKFWVGMDMKVHEINPPENELKSQNGRAGTKDRRA